MVTTGPIAMLAPIQSLSARISMRNAIINERQSCILQITLDTDVYVLLGRLIVGAFQHLKICGPRKNLDEGCQDPHQLSRKCTGHSRIGVSCRRKGGISLQRSTRSTHTEMSDRMADSRLHFRYLFAV